MTLSKHEQDFADAMALKLHLDREARFTEARLREEYGAIDPRSKLNKSRTVVNLAAKLMW